MNIVLVAADVGVILCLLAVVAGLVLYAYGESLVYVLNWRKDGTKARFLCSAAMVLWLLSSAVYGIVSTVSGFFGP